MIILKKVILGTILGATLVAGTVLSPALPAEQVTQVSAAAKYKAGVTITKDSAKVKKMMASNKKKTGNSYTTESLFWVDAFEVQKGVFKTMELKLSNLSSKKLGVHKDLKIKKGLMYYKNKKFTGSLNEISAFPAYKELSYYSKGKLVSFEMEYLGMDDVTE